MVTNSLCPICQIGEWPAISAITALSQGGRQQSLLVDTTFPGEWSAETKSEIGGSVCAGCWWLLCRCVQVHRHHSGAQVHRQADRHSNQCQMPHTDHHHQQQTTSFPRTGSRGGGRGPEGDTQAGTLLMGTSQSQCHLGFSWVQFEEFGT